MDNEEVLIDGFLSGVKSSQLTYLWSDFGSKPLDGMQANGRTVERSVDRLLNSKRGTESLSTENCIDWYWVYSIGGVVVYEEYSHTTCGGEGCGTGGLRVTNQNDACLDEGTNGGGGEEVDEINLKKLKYCHQNIIRDVIGATKYEFKQIIDKFNGNQPVPYNYNVDFQYGICNSSSSGAACTDKDVFQNWITVKINEDATKESTDIFMALTFLHEMLHAYLKFEVLHHHSNCDLSCLMNDYLYNNAGTINHHALFAEERFLNNISIELKNFAISRGYNVGQLGDQYFKDLAWAGLHKTSVWESLPSSDKTRILNTLNAEKSNQALGNVFPKGTKACII